MIHYHGTPIGGTKSNAAEFLIGKHALVSFAYPEQIDIVAECCQSFILDNGAFSAWKQSKPLDVDNYIAWVRYWHRHPSFDWALIPDAIDGDEQTNDALLDTWRIKAPDLSLYGVPVWHLHETLDRLRRLTDEFRIVALGSSGEWPTPGTRKWWKRMQEVMLEACDVFGQPKAKLHGLRMMSPKIFPYLPLSSADSTNAAVNQGSKKRFGQYVPPTSALRATVIAARVERFNSCSFWDGGPSDV